MMRTLLLLATLVSAAWPAHGTDIEIAFEFATSSSVTAYGGQVQAPPQGSLASANGLVAVPGAGLVWALPGASELRGAGFDLTVNAMSLGATVAGSLAASQVGVANANLAAGLSELTLTGPLVLNLMGDLDCGGSFEMCSLLGSFPVAVDGDQTIPAGNAFVLRDVNVLGQAELEGTLVLSYSGTTAVVHLIGKEVGRTYLPEPGTLVGLGAGIPFLWLLSKGRRRARRRQADGAPLTLNGRPGSGRSKG